MVQVNIDGIRHVNIENNRMRNLDQLDQFRRLESLNAEVYN
jgi:hypothetical protein